METQKHTKMLKLSTHFKPSIITNLVNHLLDVNLIIIHKYLLFAVKCTNAEALTRPLTQLPCSTVSVLFSVLQHQQQHRAQR